MDRASAESEWEPVRARETGTQRHRNTETEEHRDRGTQKDIQTRKAEFA